MQDLDNLYDINDVMLETGINFANDRVDGATTIFGIPWVDTGFQHPISPLLCKLWSGLELQRCLERDSRQQILRDANIGTHQDRSW